MRKFWRVLKFAALGLLGAVGASLIWLAVANAAANGRLEKKLDELKAAGQPLSLAELAHKPIAPDANAATYLRRARDELNAIQDALLAAEDALAEKDAAAYAAYINGRPNESMRQVAATAFEAHPHVMELLDTAAACADYDSQLNFDTDAQAFTEQLIEHVGDTRMAIRVLDRRVLWLLAEGRTEEAMRTCLVMHRLCRHFDREPMLVSYLVSLAVRGVASHATYLVLCSGPIGDAAHDALEKELARYDAVAACRQALVTERAFGLQWFGEMADDWRLGFARFPSFKQDQCDYLEWMETVMRGLSRPYGDHETRVEATAIAMRVGTFTELIVPAIRPTTEATARTQAQVRAVRILNALGRREPSPAAGEPALAGLGLPREVLVDPYNGEQMHVKKRPDGWLVYSVGRNLQDDGGRVGSWPDSAYEDVGWGPIKSAPAPDREKPDEEE